MICDDLDGGDRGGGRPKEGGDICVCVCIYIYNAVSLHCTAETNVVKCLYSNLKKHCSALKVINYGFVFSCSVVTDSLRPHSLSLPDSSVHEILQARILEWVATSFSRGSSLPRD